MSTCGTCGHIGAEEKWGEENPWTQRESTPAPVNFERLQWTGLHEPWFAEGNVYRCRECEAHFFLTIASSSGLAGNSDYDHYTLKRRDPPSAAELGRESGRREAAQLLTAQCWQRGDLAFLEQLLGVERARVDVLETLAVLVAGRPAPSVRLERPELPDARTTMPAGTDFASLEPRLRGFLSGPPDVAQAAARALARHLLRQARQDELQALLETGRPAEDSTPVPRLGIARVRALMASAGPGPVQAGAMRALKDAGRDRFMASGGARDAVRALMLHHVRTRAWQAASALVKDLSTKHAAAEAIRDIAQGALPVDGPMDLSPLEPALRRASRGDAPARARAGIDAAAAALEALRKRRSWD